MMIQQQKNRSHFESINNESPMEKRSASGNRRFKQNPINPHPKAKQQQQQQEALNLSVEQQHNMSAIDTLNTSALSVQHPRMRNDLRHAHKSGRDAPIGNQGPISDVRAPKSGATINVEDNNQLQKGRDN